MSDTDLVYDSASRHSPFGQALVDLYGYRGLVRLVVQRDLTVRYKRSLLGVSWTVLNPVLTSLVMWAVFNAIFHPKIPGHVPYIVYLLSGVVAITYFQQGVTMTGVSMASSAGVLTKVYVPPIVFAFSAATAGAVNFLLGLIPLLLLQLATGIGVPWTFLLVPLPLLFLLLTVTGLGLIVATFAIQFNDVIDLTNVLLMLVAYLTPTFYPITIVPEVYRKFFYLNPMYSFLNVFRSLEYGGPGPTWVSCVIVILSGVVGLAVGLELFVIRWPRLAALL